MKRRLTSIASSLAIASLLAMLLVTTAVGQPKGPNGSTSSPVVTVTMDTSPWIGYGPWWIASEKGFDRANHIRIKFLNLSTTSAINTAIVSGKAQVANLANSQLFQVLGAHVGLKAVLVEDYSDTGDAVLADGSIRSMKELKGKKIAYETGSTSDVLIHYALAANGLKNSDIQSVNIPAASAATALIAGRVDAAVTYEPYLTTALSKDKKLRRIYKAGSRPGLISDVLVVGTSFAQKNPSAVIELLKAWQDAISFYRSHTSEGQAIIAKHVGASVGDLKTSFAGVPLYDLRQSLGQLTGKYGQVQGQVAGILRTEGTIQGAIPPMTQVIDASFNRRALR